MTAAQARAIVALVVEAAAKLHENLDPRCSHEEDAGDPGVGAMRAILMYRDDLRALATDAALIRLVRKAAKVP